MSIDQKKFVAELVQDGLLSLIFPNPDTSIEAAIDTYYKNIFQLVEFDVGGSFEQIFESLKAAVIPLQPGPAALKREFMALKREFDDIHLKTAFKTKLYVYSCTFPTNEKIIVDTKYTSFADLKNEICPRPLYKYNLYLSSPLGLYALTEKNALSLLNEYQPQKGTAFQIQVKHCYLQPIHSATSQQTQSVLNPYHPESRFYPLAAPANANIHPKFTAPFTTLNYLPASFSTLSREEIIQKVSQLNDSQITNVFPEFGSPNSMTFNYLCKAFSLPYDIHKLLETDPSDHTSTSQSSWIPPISQQPLFLALQGMIDLLFNDSMKCSENNILPYFVMSLLPFTMNANFSTFKASIHFHSEYQQYGKLFDIISSRRNARNSHFQLAFSRLLAQKSDFALVYKTYPVLIFEFQKKYENVDTTEDFKAKKTPNTLVHQEILNTNNPSRLSLWKMTFDKYNELSSKYPAITAIEMFQQLSKLFVLHGLVESNRVIILKLRLMNLKHLIDTYFLGTCAWDIPFCSYEKVVTCQSRNLQTFWTQFDPLVPQLYQVFAALKDAPSVIAPKIPCWVPTINKDYIIPAKSKPTLTKTKPFSTIFLIPTNSTTTTCVQLSPPFQSIPLCSVGSDLHLCKIIPNITVFRKLDWLPTKSWVQSPLISAHMMVPFKNPSGTEETLFIKCLEIEKTLYYPNSFSSPDLISKPLQSIPWKDLPGKPSPIFGAQLSYYAKTCQPIQYNVWCEASLCFEPDNAYTLNMATFSERSKHTFINLVKEDPNNLTLLFQGLVKQVESLHEEKLIHGDIFSTNILVVPKPENFPENQIFNVLGKNGKMYGMILIDFTHACPIDASYMEVRDGKIHPPDDGNIAKPFVDFYSIMIFLEKIIKETGLFPSEDIYDIFPFLDDSTLTSEIVMIAVKKLSHVNT